MVILSFVVLLLALATGLALTALGLPGLWLLLAGVLASLWIHPVAHVTLGLFAALAALGVAAELLEFACSYFGAKKLGVSTAAVWGGIAGGIAGALILGSILPIVGAVPGAFLGTFLGAFAVAWGRGGSSEDALKQGAGAFAARVAATAAKLGAGLAMALLGLIALLSLALLVPPPAAAEELRAGKPFDDSKIRISHAPDHLWRAPGGAFVGTFENDALVLTYDFFTDRTADGIYKECPSRRGDERAPDCAAYQRAVLEAMTMWADATKRVVLRRRTDPSQPVNIWIAWTDAWKEERPPIAQAVDNSRYADAERPDSAKEIRGFDKPAFPREFKGSAALLFNDKYCWMLDQDFCPPAITHPNGKTTSETRKVRQVALHEAGHVFGFLHFAGSDTIMGMAGGSERYELTAYDRVAARLLYIKLEHSLRRGRARSDGSANR